MEKRVMISLFGIFLAAAGVQYNDPDPYIWAPIYGGVAYFCYRGWRGLPQPKWLFKVSWGLFVAAPIWLIIVWKDWEYTSLEPIYEAGGLILSGAAVQWLHSVSERTRPEITQST